MNRESPSHAGSVIGGLIIIAIGVWFLLGALGVRLPGLGQFWPIFPMLGGLAFIGMYLFGDEEEPGILIPGVSGFLVGLFFFLVTLGPLEWADLALWWPIFPLIGGIAFVITWFVDRDEPGLLVPGFGGVIVGLVGFLFTLGDLDPSWIAQGWPLILIVVGLLILAQSLRGRS